MTIDCPRCATSNSSWERRCRSCWLPFDATVRATALPDRASDRVPAATAADVADTSVEDAAHKSLADLLGIEVEHVRALADNGIHTLEHIAQSLPDRIEHALGAWMHIDPGALIARARQLLHHTNPVPQRPSEQEVDPAQWWKMT